MKHFKHIIATALTLFMAFALAVPAWAADPTYTITVPAGDTHEYKIYQVLTGTLSAADSKELGNPEWGADVVANPGEVDAFIASLEGKTEAQIANLVSAKVDTTKAGQGTVSYGEPKSGLAAGYYVLVDVTDPLGKNDTKSLNVVKVVGNVTFNKKWDTTSDDKEIVSDTLGKDDATTNAIGKDDNNVSVGDTVNYKITAKVPAKATDYNYFYFIINDTLSEGLTLDADSIKVYKGSVATANELPTTAYQVKTKTADGIDETFQVALNDAKSLAGQDIIVTYSAVLNENAVIGGPNPNTSTVKFSNNPNDDYDGQNYPGFPDEDEDGAFGETPETETRTYTTGIEIQKVDQDGNVLTGATFELSGQSTKTVLTVAEEFVVDNENGVYYKLNDGTYTKTAPTTTGEYMKPAEPGATAGYVIDDTATAETEGYKEVGGVKYRPYVPQTDQGKDIYVLTTGNGHLYDSTTTKYKKTTTKTTNDATTTHKAEMAVDENGLARFDGLGAGTYTIHEKVTPDGYNTLPDLTVTVTFDENGTQKFTFTGGEGTYDAAEGIYKIKIQNNKGTELPETGGIGTTLFYIVGGIMVVAAGALLITKKRVNE